MANAIKKVHDRLTFKDLSAIGVTSVVNPNGGATITLAFDKLKTMKGQGPGEKNAEIGHLVDMLQADNLDVSRVQFPYPKKNQATGDFPVEENAGISIDVPAGMPLSLTMPIIERIVEAASKTPMAKMGAPNNNFYANQIGNGR